MAKEWVAVAYEEDFFVGQIEKKLANKVRVTFLEQKKDAFFSWPKRQGRHKACFYFLSKLRSSTRKRSLLKTSNRTTPEI